MRVRLFKDDARFVEVYDWIGSLNKHPKYFELKEYNQSTVLPNAMIFSGSFNTAVIDFPLLISPSGIVAFNGHGVKVT